MAIILPSDMHECLTIGQGIQWASDEVQQWRYDLGRIDELLQNP